MGPLSGWGPGENAPVPPLWAALKRRVAKLAMFKLANCLVYGIQRVPGPGRYRGMKISPAGKYYG